MAGIVQLSPGGSAQAPAGAVSIKLSTVGPAEVLITRPDGEIVQPQFRVSAHEVVVVPGAELLVGARSVTGEPFPPGTRIGISFRSPGGAGGEIVRPAAEVGGHHNVMIVRLGADGLLSDLMSDSRKARDGAWSRSWRRAGSYAFHVNHQDIGSADVPWAMVLDASASILVEERRDTIGAFTEILVGVVATAFGNLPSKLLLATDPIRDVVNCLDSDDIDWDESLGHEPAPWPRVTPAVREAAQGGKAVALLLDGVPVDYRELTAFAKESATRMVIVAVGRSQYGVRPEDGPSQFWDEELAALDELASLDSVRLVASTDLAAVVADGAQLADALFPQVTIR